MFRLLLALCSRLLRDNQRHDQINYRDSSEAREERQHGQQADDGRVNAEIFAQSRAHTRDHAVGCTACQLLVVGVHVALLSMISIQHTPGNVRGCKNVTLSPSAHLHPWHCLPGQVCTECTLGERVQVLLRINSAKGLCFDTRDPSVAAITPSGWQVAQRLFVRRGKGFWKETGTTF